MDIKAEKITLEDLNKYKEKIIVKGEIQIGKELELIKDKKKSGNEGLTTNIAGTENGYLAEDKKFSFDNSDGINLDQVVYSFNNINKDVVIKDKGLTECYGIFGAPGSGKTYLLMHLLKQLFNHEKGNSKKKYGGLILDPKAALINDIKAIAKESGRNDDLVIINTEEMIKNKVSVNIINSFLNSENLGKALVLAARCAGVSASEPYWLQVWEDLFGAVIFLLEKFNNSKPSLKILLDTILGLDFLKDECDNVITISKLETILEKAENYYVELDNNDPVKNDISISIEIIKRHLTDNRERTTVSSLINNAYGIFRKSKCFCYSDEINNRNLYDETIQEGKIILVSVSSENLILSKILCTLMKSLFQQTVLSRYDRYNSDKKINFTRPLLLIADEYSDVATELKGQPMGDSRFFSLCRQNGCMGLIATQSIHMLNNSSLGEAWKGIYSNFAGKIFMRVGDKETSEEASKLAGDSDYFFTSKSSSLNKEGLGEGTQRDLREKKALPSIILTQQLKVGEAVLIGTTDGSETKPEIKFIKIKK